MKLQLRRRHVWTIAVAAAATVLVVLLILIAAGTLTLPGASGPAPVSVSSVQITLLQGTNASGNGWFGPSTITYAGLGSGYPYQVPPGSSFSVPVTLQNYDSTAHTLYSVAVGAPFSFSSSSPALPATLRALQDDALLEISVTAPSTAGASGTLFITINALPPTS